jgi:hypothetical protein
MRANVVQILSNWTKRTWNQAIFLSNQAIYKSLWDKMSLSGEPWFGTNQAGPTKFVWQWHLSIGYWKQLFLLLCTYSLSHISHTNSCSFLFHFSVPYWAAEPFHHLLQIISFPNPIKVTRFTLYYYLFNLNMTFYWIKGQIKCVCSFYFFVYTKLIVMMFFLQKHD